MLDLIIRGGLVVTPQAVGEMDVGVQGEKIVAVGWPGEKLVAGAGANRLRVLVSGLRSGGLKDVLRSAEGGYFLAPDVAAVSD